ncbi:MAG: hypothetical protein ACI9M3_000902 [Bacteroidia bacterium]|jgi:hypothetical protein
MKNTIKLGFLVLIIGMYACSEEATIQPTEVEEKFVPTLTTVDITGITNTSAMSGGMILGNGGEEIIERGVCYSELTSPNINNNVVKSGAGDGSFVTEITGLTKDKKYYVRAYATTTSGTGYGNEVEFTAFGLESFTFAGKKTYIFPTNSGAGIWGPDDVTAATNTQDGAGNTAKIALIGGAHLANKCADLDAYGHSDWYMPSYEELKALRTAAPNLDGIGENDGPFWSSSENSEESAFFVDFNTAVPYASSLVKNEIGQCRCVRQD